MRAEREMGAGEERRWRGCFSLILILSAGDKEELQTSAGLFFNTIE